MNDTATHATMAGTLRYAQRFQQLAPDHFRQRYGLTLSSIGLGTYLGGRPNDDGVGYEGSVRQALAVGCNVIDTAVNYRYMQSEREVGRALAALFKEGEI